MALLLRDQEFFPSLMEVSNPRPEPILSISITRSRSNKAVQLGEHLKSLLLIMRMRCVSKIPRPHSRNQNLLFDFFGRHAWVWR